MADTCHPDTHDTPPSDASLIPSQGRTRTDAWQQHGPASGPDHSPRVFVVSSPSGSLPSSSTSIRAKRIVRAWSWRTTSLQCWLAGTAFLSLLTYTDVTPRRSRSCRSLAPDKTPNNEERHPLSLAARWGGVFYYERLKCFRLPRGYLMLHSGSLETRCGVSSLRGGDAL